MTTTKSLVPAVAIHPGEHLLDELEARKISQLEFAKMIGYQKSQLNEVIKRKRGINADLALLLQSALGIEASYWLNLQKNYELDLAKIEAKNQARLEALELWRMLSEMIPVSFFKQNNCLSGDPVNDIPVIKSIYGISHLEQLATINTIPALRHFRRSEKQQSDKSNLIAWFKLCEYKARQIIVNEFNHGVQDNLIKDLNAILYQNNNTLYKIERRLAEAGIKLVTQERGEKMPVDGVTFWSNGNPTIGLSLRYKRIDWLAFTLFHELGHVFLHLVNNNQAIIIDVDKEDPDYKRSKEEVEADEFAQNHLINRSEWDTFFKSYSYGDKPIIEFSEKLQINPGIVLGRICHTSGNYKERTKINRNIQ